MWPSKVIVPIAFAVLAARLVLQIVGYGRAFWLGLERPVAVPLIQSVAEQARAEAEALSGAEPEAQSTSRAEAEALSGAEPEAQNTSRAE